MKEIINTTARTASTIAAEIRFLDRQAANTCIQYIIEIGRRLVEAKALVGDGQWLDYIKTELKYEKSTAQNYMRLYERFGNSQTSMYGSFADSQTFGSLTYTKALALLQVPDEDLEEFAETHDIESMSTRELKQAIKERDDAIKAKEDAERRADAAVQSRDDNLKEYILLQQQADQEKKQVEQLTAGMIEAADKLEAKDAEVENLKSQLANAQKKEADAKAALKKAKENPDIPAAMMEQLRTEAEVAGAKKAMEQVRKELEEAERQKEMAQEELRKSEERLAAVQKSAQLANPDAAVFKSIFEQVQTDFNRLHGALMKVNQTDPATGEKLLTATKALLDKLRKDISG